MLHSTANHSMLPSSTPHSKCSNNDELFHNTCRQLHFYGYANIVFCVIGTVFNFFIFMVYTSKHMTSTMHTIIANLAAVDTICMIVYIPHSLQELTRSAWYPIAEHRTEPWEQFSFYSWHLANVFTNISTCLTLMLGVWRYIGIIHPLKERSWCNTKTTRIVIIACYITGIVVSLPLFSVTRVKETHTFTDDRVYGHGVPSKSQTGKCTRIYEALTPQESKPYIFEGVALFYGVMLKILPSVLLTIISYKLIVALREAKSRHELLTRNTSTISGGATPRLRRPRHTTKITKMLLIVLIIFVLRELPHGIYCVLTAIFGINFYRNYYFHSSEIFNTINYFCTCTYFVVYYAMSIKFRNGFKSLLKCERPSSGLHQNTSFASVYNNAYIYCNIQNISPTSKCNSPTYSLQKFFP